MNEVLEKIQKIGIVPVVVLDDAKDAAPLAKALCEGGLPCAEVTFRTAAAEESIRIMAKEFPEMLVGAGTVLTTEQVDRAVNAGAKFIVSPGLNPTVVKYCVDKGIPVTPGTSNPSDVEMAISLGLDVVNPSHRLRINMDQSYETVQMVHADGRRINEARISTHLWIDKILLQVEADGRKTRSCWESIRSATCQRKLSRQCLEPELAYISELELRQRDRS